MQISHDGMFEDIVSIHEQQRDIGYPLTLVEGTEASAAYMRDIVEDWQAQGITSVLHEKKGGYANNTKAMCGLAGKA